MPSRMQRGGAVGKDDPTGAAELAAGIVFDYDFWLPFHSDNGHPLARVDHKLHDAVVASPMEKLFGLRGGSIERQLRRRAAVQAARKELGPRAHPQPE